MPWAVIIYLCCSQLSSLAASPEIEIWRDEIENKAFAVNEGDLVFLQPQADRAVHHHHNYIILPRTRFNDGWVYLRQCHEHIDQVPEAQVLFKKERVRDLTIVSLANITKAWVEDNSVQLRDVQPNAKLCISVFSKSLIANPDGTYILRNGPFMRRFLDGYYPMHVTMEVEMPPDCLQVLWIVPPQQDGFQVRIGHNRVSIETWFEGRLVTEIAFLPTSSHRQNESHCQF